MRSRFAWAIVLMLVWPVPLLAQQQPSPTPSRLKVFLDCDECFGDYIREEVGFVEYVRDPREADVHVLVTSSRTGSGGRERTVAFIGLGRLKGVDYSIKALTESSDSEDTQRQRLATAITIGLLNYVSRDGVSGGLTVEASQDSRSGSRAGVADPWNFWVISLRGTVSLNGEESQRETSLRGSVGADRITDGWKITIGASADYERQAFDLDEEDPLRVTRRERELEGLVVRSVTDHWSLGLTGNVETSSFNNIALASSAAPAVEYNLFPYSAYTRRQLRMNYAIGPYRARYVEETLFGKRSETLTRQQGSITLERQEPWGSLDVRFEVSNYLPGLDRHRLEVEGDVTIRLARGLSLSIDGRASRLRDQLAIPRRGVTQEEVLLRLRRLRSGYEYGLQVGLTYRFGSIFNTIVNPRFGQ